MLLKFCLHILLYQNKNQNQINFFLLLLVHLYEIVLTLIYVSGNVCKSRTSILGHFVCQFWFVYPTLPYTLAQIFYVYVGSWEHPSLWKVTSLISRKWTTACFLNFPCKMRTFPNNIAEFHERKFHALSWLGTSLHNPLLGCSVWKIKKNKVDFSLLRITLCLP